MHIEYDYLGRGDCVDISIIMYKEQRKFQIANSSCLGFTEN